MIQRLLLIALACLPFLGSAQCVPDTSITHNVNGVYPDSATGLPHAIVGSTYSTDIQIKVLRDTTYSLGPLTLPAVIDSFNITGVRGLPAGFTYSCNPSGCSFPGGSSACLNLTGPAPTISMVGVYPITVNVTAYGTVTGLGSATQDDSISYYSLYIDNSTGISLVSTPERLTVSNFSPNPASAASLLILGVPTAGVARIEMTDLIGNRISERSVSLDKGMNRVTVDLSDLHAGIYLAKVYFGKEAVMRRLIVTNR